MPQLNPKPGLKNLRYDFPAAVVVFLVALPLCLGVALASGVPAFSGIIAGAVGGILIGLLSGSSLSVSGPAAGLTVIVLAAVQSLPSFEVFLLAVFLSGVLQLLLGIFKAGIIAEFIPAAVIQGMLSAIGLILILKQIPHAMGHDKNTDADFSFLQTNGRNTLSEIASLADEVLSHGAIFIALFSLLLLVVWDGRRVKTNPLLSIIPGPLLVVAGGIVANTLFARYSLDLFITPEHRVNIPVAADAAAFFRQFTIPDFSELWNLRVWTIAATLAIVASLETLLSIEAADKLDPLKRTTPVRRELIAQGAGNMVSGLLGGMPVTSVMVRSSANASAGGRTKMATILHGCFLLLAVACLPRVLNLIPLSALAAVLISVGYKLTRPAIFRHNWKQGYLQFIPFISTLLAILLTDLLRGVLIGIFIAAALVVFAGYSSALVYLHENGRHLIRFLKTPSFVHKPELRNLLRKIPGQSTVLIDLSGIDFVDHDTAQLLNDFIDNAPLRDIQVEVKRHTDHPHPAVKEPVPAL